MSSYREHRKKYLSAINNLVIVEFLVSLLLYDESMKRLAQRVDLAQRIFKAMEGESRARSQ